MILSNIRAALLLPASPRPPLRLRRWRLVALPCRRASQGSTQQRWLSGNDATDLQPNVGGRAACSEDAGDYVEVSPIFTTPTSLLLIKMKLSKANASTISQSELLALIRLAKARKLIQETAKDQPVVSAIGVTKDKPVWTIEQPSEHPRGGPGAQQQTSRQKRIQAHPLDVCALLLRAEIKVSDLPLLKDLDKVAEEAEATQQSEGVWWWLARFFGLQRRRRDLWAAAAARLQQSKSASTNISTDRGTEHFEITENATLPDVDNGVRDVTNNAFSLTAASRGGHFENALSSGISSKGLSLGPATGPAMAAADTAATSGLSGSMQRRRVLQPTAASQQAARRPSIASSFNRFLSSTAPLTDEDSGDCEGAAYAAAAAVSRLSSDSLVLLPHGCKWPFPVGAAAARPPGETGNDKCSAGYMHFKGLYDADVEAEEKSSSNLWRAGPPPTSWKAAVRFHLTRGRGVSSRKRELARQRQRLSPLDPPFTADALLLHPFCPIGAVDLPDAETSRASEVHEVSLGFLSKTMATETCPQCSSAEVPVGQAPGDSVAARCPLHQRLHYRKVGGKPNNLTGGLPGLPVACCSSFFCLAFWCIVRVTASFWFFLLITARLLAARVDRGRARKGYSYSRHLHERLLLRRRHSHYFPRGKTGPPRRVLAR